VIARILRRIQDNESVDLGDRAQSSPLICRLRGEAADSFAVKLRFASGPLPIGSFRLQQD